MKTLVVDKQFKQATKDLETLIIKARKKLFVLETLASRQEIRDGKVFRGNIRQLARRII